MSADGEIEIAVTAEGADDAAAEVADAQPQAAGGGQGGGGLSAGLGRAGGIGFILSKLLGPLLDVLAPIQQLLEAFLAPVAVVLLRLLQPAIRLLIKVLPVWLNFMSAVLNVVEFIQATSRDVWAAINRWVPQLPSLIWDFMQTGFNWLVTEITSLPGEIWTRVQQLAGMIAQRIRAALPSLNTGNVVDDATSAADEFLSGFNRGGGGQQPNININLSGGLDQLVERIERDTNFDF